MLPTVHFEPVQIEGAVRPFLVGRVYYQGSYEEKSAFDAVFLVILRGDGTAFVMAAHGRFNFRAYAAIARRLLDDWGVARCDMTRHGKPLEVDTARASGFGELPG